MVNNNTTPPILIYSHTTLLFNRSLKNSVTIPIRIYMIVERDKDHMVGTIGQNDNTKATSPTTKANTLL